MITIRLIEAQKAPVPQKTLERTLADALKKYRQGTSARCTVEIFVTDDEEMRELNRTHRNVDKTTDVLSLPTTFDTTRGEVIPVLKGVPRELGVIIISMDQAERQVGRFGDTIEDEFLGLATHGLRHLLGHDHDNKGNWIEID